MVEGFGFQAVGDMEAPGFETAVESVADAEVAITIFSRSSICKCSRSIPGREKQAGDYGAGNNAGSDDAVHRTDAATVYYVALVDRTPEKKAEWEEVEVKDGDAAGRGEGVPGDVADGVGSWPSRRSIPGFPP